MAHRKFSKIKGERGAMMFSQFDGYSSDQAARNARDKEVKRIRAEGKTCKVSVGNAYAGGTFMKTYKITEVKKV